MERLASSRLSLMRCASPPEERDHLLAEFEVAEADGDEGVEDADDARMVGKDDARFVDGRVEILTEVFACVGHFKADGIEAQALALFADDLDSGAENAFRLCGSRVPSRLVHMPRRWL